MKKSFFNAFGFCILIFVLSLFNTTAHAKCNLVTTTNVNAVSLKTDVNRSLGSASDLLFRQTVTANYTNCDSPISDLTFGMTVPTFLSQTGNPITSSGTAAIFFGRQFICTKNVEPFLKCLDAQNSLITKSINVVNSGISYTVDATIQSTCKNIITTTTTDLANSPPLTLSLSTNNTICNNFQLVYTLNIFRGTDSILSNLTKVTFTPVFKFLINAKSSTDTSLIFANQLLLDLTNLSFQYKDGTCALVFSTNNVNLGSFSSSTIQETAANSSITNSAQNVTITVSNCTGTAIGRKKVFLVDFLTPRSGDNTLMDNQLTTNEGGASGISARITADSRIDPTTGTALPLVVKRGEAYISSAGSSDTSIMTYKAEFVRNSDNVTPGKFSSSAFFTMSYL